MSAHVLSERPQSVLCRIDLPCDLIISLRSLKNKAESIIVVVEVDQQYWRAVDRFKSNLSFKNPDKIISIFSCSYERIGFGPNRFCNHSKENRILTLSFDFHSSIRERGSNCNSIFSHNFQLIIFV